MNICEEVEARVEKILDSEVQSAAHRIDHIRRVLHNALTIAAHHPQADIETLRLAILLHDIDQPFDQKHQHVQLSAKRARNILAECDCPAEQIERVVSIIEEHSTEHIDEVKPSTLEARIVFDADKVDGVSVSGIARVFCLFGQAGKTPLQAIDWYREKIDTALANMQTTVGRQLFVEKMPYVMQFLDQLEEENIDVRK